MSLHLLGADDLAPSGGTVVAVAVGPEDEVVEAGGTLRLVAVASDAAGRTFTPPVVSWSVEGGGSVDPSGLFTAPADPCACTVTAQVGRVRGRAEVRVVEADPAAEDVDDVEYPRQGLASFHASPEEIDVQPDTRRMIRAHYPDLSELENRPHDREVADRWAGFDLLGHLPGGAFAVPAAPGGSVSPGGGGFSGHHHHHHDHGPGWGLGPWGWGGYYGLPAYEIDDEVDADAIADLVADKVAARVAFAAEGVDAVGAYDVAAFSRQMNRLKQVTASVARALLKGGTRAIDLAIATAKGRFYQTTLPGGTAREEVKAHLAWHAAELAKATDPTATYAPGEDLKRYVFMAFVEANAAEEGRARMNQMWSEMWDEIGEAILALPGKIADAVMSIPNRIVQGITGIPLWGWSLILLTGVGLLGYAAFRLLKPAVPAIVGAAADRYLLGGR